MKKEFKGKSKRSGVYQIKNIQNGKVYIGSAKCFQVRASQHETRLNKGKHSNKHLLASWKKYGSKNFVFEVLEVTNGTTEERRIIEQKYITQQIENNNWENCYNKVEKTITKSGSWSLNPEQTRKKLSDASQKRWANPEYRIKMIRALKKSGSKKCFQKKMSKISKRMWRNPSIKEKILENLQKRVAKSYILISPSGMEIIITNLQKFCFENNLCKRTMRKIISGTKISYKGWQSPNARKDSRFGFYVLMSPQGERIEITNLRRFCKEKNIKYENLQSVVYGRSKIYRGYSLGKE